MNISEIKAANKAKEDAQAIAKTLARGTTELPIRSQFGEEIIREWENIRAANFPGVVGAWRV